MAMNENDFKNNLMRQWTMKYCCVVLMIKVKDNKNKIVYVAQCMPCMECCIFMRTISKKKK